MRRLVPYVFIGVPCLAWVWLSYAARDLNDGSTRNVRWQLDPSSWQWNVLLGLAVLGAIALVAMVPSVRNRHRAQTVATSATAGASVAAWLALLLLTH